MKIVDAFAPSLTALSTNLVAAVFPLMKAIPAGYCVRRAVETGLVRDRTMVMETSSGSMALGLAIACKRWRVPLTIVSDYSCDAVLRMRLEDLSATIELVSQPAPVGGYQAARLARLEEIRARIPDHWWLNQYDNPNNAEAYCEFAAQLREQLGRVDCLVGSVGSGGSMSGASRCLKTMFSGLQVVGVDTFHSVLFGQPDGPRELRGLGNSILPMNLDHSLFDEVHWVSAAEAYSATRILHRATGLFRGGTSGAVWMVANHWAAMHPQKTVVCIFPDGGSRYLTTIYDDGYLKMKNLWVDELPSRPRPVQSPASAGPSWSVFPWNRRRYQDLASPAASRALTEPAHA